MVLDVGGYIGLSSVFFALKGAEAIACIEPYPPSAERILENLRMAGFEDKVRLFKAGLSGEAGTGILAVASSETQSNTLQNAGRSSAPADFDEAVEVPVMTIEDFLQELGWDTVDVVKLDCEGCEYALFATASDDTLRKVKAWVMEFHDGAERILNRLRPLDMKSVLIRSATYTHGGKISSLHGGISCPIIIKNKLHHNEYIKSMHESMRQMLTSPRLR